MYQLWGGAPFTREPKTGHVVDRRGERLSLIGAAPQILAARGGAGRADEEDDGEAGEDEEDDEPFLSWRGWEATEVAYDSRTEHAEWGRGRAARVVLSSRRGGAARTARRRNAQERGETARARSGAAPRGLAGSPAVPNPGVVPHLHALASHREIYPGSKIAHFRRILERSGCDYGDMLFLDNERHNVAEVARLGVVSVHCPRGLTWAAWEEGVRKFAESKAAGGAAAAGAGAGGAGVGRARRKNQT